MEYLRSPPSADSTRPQQIVLFPPTQQPFSLRTFWYLNYFTFIALHIFQIFYTLRIGVVMVTDKLHMWHVPKMVKTQKDLSSTSGREAGGLRCCSQNGVQDELHKRKTWSAGDSPDGELIERSTHSADMRRPTRASTRAAHSCSSSVSQILGVSRMPKMTSATSCST